MGRAKSVFEAPLDGITVAEGVAQDLARLMGERLVKVLLYGSWARGDAGADSDVDILAVVSEVDPADNNLSGPVSELVGDWFERSGRLVSIQVVSEAELRTAVDGKEVTAADAFLRAAASESRTLLDVAA